jgi:hypothetical protein
LQAGSAGQPTVFLFSDNQMKEESFLEDINILNTGVVTMPGDALQHIPDACKRTCTCGI